MRQPLLSAACCLVLAAATCTLSVGASSAERGMGLVGDAGAGVRMHCAAGDISCRRRLLTSGSKGKPPGPGHHSGKGRYYAIAAYNKNLEHIPVQKHDDGFFKPDKEDKHDKGKGDKGKGKGGGVGRYFAEQAYQKNLIHPKVEAKEDKFGFKPHDKKKG